MSLPESPDLPSGSRPRPSRMTSYTGIEFVPKRAMQSFENLVALANYEERLKEAKKIVWRDRGEKPVELADLWECIEHAGRGGMSTSWTHWKPLTSATFSLICEFYRSWCHSIRHSLRGKFDSPAGAN